jgi:hypothetical protein
VREFLTAWPEEIVAFRWRKKRMKLAELRGIAHKQKVMVCRLELKAKLGWRKRELRERLGGGKRGKVRTRWFFYWGNKFESKVPDRIPALKSASIIRMDKLALEELLKIRKEKPDTEPDSSTPGNNTEIQTSKDLTRERSRGRKMKRALKKKAKADSSEASAEGADGGVIADVLAGDGKAEEGASHRHKRKHRKKVVPADEPTQSPVIPMDAPAKADGGLTVTDVG